MIYADDTEIFQSFILEQIDAGIAYMQYNAQAVADWATEVGLELDIKKTLSHDPWKFAFPHHALQTHTT